MITTCGLHSQAHLIGAHRPGFVKVKLSKNDLRATDRNITRGNR